MHERAITWVCTVLRTEEDVEPTVIKKNPAEEEEGTVAEFKARLWMFKEPEPGVSTARHCPHTHTHAARHWPHTAGCDTVQEGTALQCS